MAQRLIENGTAIAARFRLPRAASGIYLDTDALLRCGAGETITTRG